MRIAILDLCIPDPNFDHHGSTGEILRRWLAPHMADAALTIVHVAADAPIPTPGDFDGYVLSGSEKGVYDDAGWMDPLRGFIRACRDARIPMFGVCFGHQIMADALGGRAEKADEGFIVGAFDYQVAGSAVRAHAMHQDQVTAVPPGAEVIGAAPCCPVAALRYEFPALSIQFHPEYPRAFIEDSFDVLHGVCMTDADVARGRASLTGPPVDEALWGAEAANFFREALARAAPA